MSSVTAWWWLALPLLMLPIWWHRRRRERVKASALATARFLPRADPQQLRVWEWTDRLLLLMRCLLLVAVIAWLADLALPWRGDTVLVAPGAAPAWVEQQAAQAGLRDAPRIALPAGDPFAWLRDHEREWRPGARWLLLGEIPMPAVLPAFSHRIELRGAAASKPFAPQHIAIVSEQPGRWRTLFSALGDSQRFVLDTAPQANTDLIVWDSPAQPPAGVRAPLWWVADTTAFPELEKARELNGLRYADSPHGRLWNDPAWPLRDAAQARRLFEAWQQLHVGVQTYIVPAQVIERSGQGAPALLASGALHPVLAWVLLILFGVERSLAHVRRR